MEEEYTTVDQPLIGLAGLRHRLNELEAWKQDYELVAEELRQSEDKFRKLAEKSVVGIYLIQDGILRYANPRFAEIFGYEVDEIENRLDAMAVVYVEDIPMVQENIRKRISGEVESIHFQFRGARKNGEVLHVEAYGSRVEVNGRPAVIGTLMDITDRVRAQRDLEKQLDKFQALYDLAVAMTMERSLDENLMLIVERSRELLGTDTAFIALRDEKAGEFRWHISSGVVTEEFKNLRVPIGTGLAGRVADTGQRVIVEDYFKEGASEFHDITRSEGLISGIAVPVQTGDTNYGVLFAFNRTKTPFSKSDLDTLSLLGNLAAVEITRKRALERLKESEERYKNLYQESRRREELYISFLNSSADAIVIYDLDGNAQYVSPSFTRIFGWTAEEVEGGQVPFVPDSEREATMNMVREVLGKGTPMTGFETKRNAKDGSTLDVSVSASRYHDHEGKPAGTSVILRDITGFKQLERARKRAVNHLSHELITPIAVIEGSLRQLEKGKLSELAKTKNIARMRRNLQRLKHVQTIVQEIVSTHRYQPEHCQVDDVVREALNQIRKTSSHRSVTITTDLEPIVTDFIDPRALREALTTLVKNAIENTPDEGEVCVTLKKVAADVLLQVTDYGVGIPASDRDFIFKAFHQTRETQRYSTRRPFDFNAGGKGLELMRLKLLAEEGAFDISFETHRCRYIPSNQDECPGRISSCPHVGSVEDCKNSGGTTFSVLFSKRRGNSSVAGRGEHSSSEI